MYLTAIIVVLVAIAGLAATIWVANWPLQNLVGETPHRERQRINAAHNRRHHRAVARVISSGLAVSFGVTSVSLLSGPKSDPSRR